MVHLMHLLRTSSMLVRLVLAGFVLTLGAASAAPLVQPTTLVVLCSESGTKVVMVDADGMSAHAPGHVLDCPLCLPAAPAPAGTPPAALSGPPLSAPSHCCLSVDVAASSGAPMPPRGPPAAV